MFLILDQHCFHSDIDNVNFAKENEIIMLGLPTHCTHLIQPLDKSVFCSLKSKWLAICKDMLHGRNTLQPISRNDINFLFWKDDALKPELAINGFKHSGIMPFDSTILGILLQAKYQN